MKVLVLVGGIVMRVNLVLSMPVAKMLVVYGASTGVAARGPVPGISSVKVGGVLVYSPLTVSAVAAIAHGAAGVRTLGAAHKLVVFGRAIVPD